MAGRFKGTAPGLRRGAQTERPRQARDALFQNLRAKEGENEPRGTPFGKTIELVKKKRKKADKPGQGADDGENVQD